MVPPVALLETAPEPPAAVVPEDPVDEVEDVRVVPLRDVLALEETLVEVLALDKTVVVDAAVAVGESGEVLLTLEAALVVLTLPDASAEVDAAEEEIPAVAEGVRRALPGEGVAPAPAPEDEPPVFEATAAEEPLVKED